MSPYAAQRSQEPHARDPSLPGDGAAAGGGRARGRFGWLGRFVARRLFRDVAIDADSAQSLRDLTRTHSLVYVVRYRSYFDFLLVATALADAGLPVPEFAPSLRAPWAKFVPSLARALFARLRGQHREAHARWRSEDRERCRQLVEHGRPVLIFMRSRAAGVAGVARERGALGRAHAGAEYLREIVIGQWSAPQRVAFVPLAIVRGRGYRRKESRLATLVYTVRQAPGEIRRLLSFLWNRRDTSVVIGRDVSLPEIIERHRAEGADRIVRRLSRALLIFLYREERMVQGPTLLSKADVGRIVLADPQLERYIERTAWATRQPAAKLRRVARRHFEGMAANYQSIYISFFELVLNRIWRRMFSDIRWTGVERVAEKLKQHPIVLVPCHRSHLDYLLLSYIFHRNHLSPPHIAAGDNLAFWPLGPIFRGAGAYFIRRSFGDDELYKLVFRSYLGFLIREGYTQEFFIEGSRSRTGKLLTAKLGMLSAIVDAFLRGARRELYLVPVSIQYSRIVEEQAYQRELEGAAKEKESIGALLRARRVLEQQYGDVQVTFAEPISLREALGADHEALRASSRAEPGAVPAPELDERRRRFVDDLAQRILREINGASVVNGTAIAATVLLGAETPALRYRDFLERAAVLVRLLQACGAPLAELSDFGATRRFLENAGLLRRLPEVPDVVHVPRERRRSLDFYKNNAIHWFLVPALASEGLLRGRRPADLTSDLREWLDLYRLEFPPPSDADLEAGLGRVLGHFGAVGVSVDGGCDTALLAATQGVLDSFHEPYWVVADVLSRLEEAGISESMLLDRIGKRYQAAFLLGEVHKPEGESSLTIKNAIERFRLAGGIVTRARPGRLRARDGWVTPGGEMDAVRRWATRLEAALRRDRMRR